MTQTLALPIKFRLAFALEHAGLTVDDMAAELGCHRNTVLNYLAGRTPVRRPALRSWAMATGVPMSWLEGATDSDVLGSTLSTWMPSIPGQQAFTLEPLPVAA
jgi:transcriptional regulator with XRE-family HTH domain